MASALPGDVCVGQHSVCLIRIANLGRNCAPSTDPNAGIVTAGIVSATATPVFRDEQEYEARTPCGKVAWRFLSKKKIIGYDISGELTYFDHEAMMLLFGGTQVVGAPGTPFDGKVIGWGSSWETDLTTTPAKYLEFIVRAAPAGVGECIEGGGPFAVGHIFGRTVFKPGDRTFEGGAATLKFTAKAVANANLGLGPWQDWPGAGTVPDSAHTEASYSLEEYDAIMSIAACGYVDFADQGQAQTDEGIDLFTDDNQPLLLS